MKFLIPILLLLATSCASYSSKNLTYTADGKTFNAYVATPKDAKEKRPAVLVVHEWWGQNEYARMRTDMLAKEGYVAMALDMYGEGVTTEIQTYAGNLAGAVYGNLKGAKKRFQAALGLLKLQPNVDATKVAAIGYFFGGGVVLHMAREGLDLD